jgi:hypothetical protein
MESSHKFCAACVCACRGGDNILVMCDCYEPPKVKADGTLEAMKPIPTNTRAACAEVRKDCRFTIVVGAKSFQDATHIALLMC